MRLACGMMIAAYGLVAIAAQTLLFREFITSFEGNDISVGVFFGSWFLWVGLGAAMVRRWARFAEALLRHIELLFLLYIPAFAAQFLLTVQIRELAGIASYAMVSIQTMVLWSMAVNAPVSLVTGLFFPVACRWIEQTTTLPVSRVYVLEALGSFAGGLTVTALLACHVSMMRISLLLALVLAVPVVIVCLFSLRGSRWVAMIVSLAIAACVSAVLLTGYDEVATRRVQQAKWSRLLPSEAFQGAFLTAQAEYLYGQYAGQWIAMREGSVCETLPDEEQAGRIAATILCQNPKARRILVIGSGPALCNRLLMLPQIERLTWAHPDAEYADRLLEILPSESAVRDSRFHPVQSEIRSYLADAMDRFDLVVVNLPDATASTLNRYHTVEFYERLKASLRADGVVAVSIAGGENVLGTELASLGASARATLATVFSNRVLAPGDQTWLIASDSQDLTDDPATARDRFAAMEGSQRIFPPAGLLSIYLPDQIAQATNAYDKAGLPMELLVNRDSRPLAHLYGLLLAARQSGASVTRFVRLLMLAGWLPFLVPVFVFIVLRMLAMADRGPDMRPSSFDSTFLVFSTGWVAIAMVLLLMYLYETHFGSLYLHVGLISSLFMAGLTAGSLFASRLLARQPGRRSVRTLLVTLLLAHAIVLAALAFSSFGSWAGNGESLFRSGHTVFAMAFALAGLCCGGYWPIAATQLAGEALHPGQAGSRLETADHLGACLGGLATSLLMVPVLGTRTSLLVLIGLLLANLPAAVAGVWRPATADTPVRGAGIRRVGYTLLGLSACVVLGSNILARVSSGMEPALPEYAIAALAGQQQTQHASVTLADSGRKAEYVTILDANEKPVGYLFSSVDFAPEVRGFGGRLNVVARADVTGKLADLLIVRSNETPSYVEILRGWLDSLKGKELFGSTPLAGVNAVAGATVSSDAVLAALRTSAQQFAAEVLQTDVGPSAGKSRIATDATALYLIAITLLAFVAIHAGGARSRAVVLVLTFVLGGLVLNVQYSTEQIVTVLSWNTPAAGLAGAFLLAVGVPILVLLFGNLYCGYLCPSRAAQELLGYVLPRRLRPTPERSEMRVARFIKCVVLTILLVGFFIARDRRTLAGDPLTSIFALRSAKSYWPRWLPMVAGAALAGSLFYTRFWCRYLCPAGAFLSLLNRVRLLRRWVPPKGFGNCEFGLTATDHLDCIYCDRCRRAGTPVSASTPRLSAGLLVLATALLGVFVAGLSVSQLRLAVPQILQESATAVGAAGQPRDLDAQRVRTLIEQGRLSNRQAEHYKRME
jgi:predicted membrane-bound spermidine synthase/Na+-translocating ferredoxin:NAD+ oxidoreductase RnfG subunit